MTRRHALTRLLTLVPAVCVSASCGGADATAATFPPPYAFLSRGSWSYAEEPALRAELPFERIELVYFSTWIWGGNRVLLEREGPALLHDDRGQWRGKVALADFARLCLLIEENGFLALQPRYEKRVFDAGQFTVRVWPAGSDEPIEVVDYAESGPIELWTIRAAIDGVARTIRWEPMDAAAEAASPR